MTERLKQPKQKQKKHRSKKPQKNRLNNPIVPMDSIKQTELEIRSKHPKVTDKQADLVAMLLHDGCTIAEACKRINANASWAYITLQKQHVMDYGNELAKRVMNWHAIRAITTMSDLLDARSEKVRREAAEDLMNRAGFGNSEGGGSNQSLVINIVT